VTLCRKLDVKRLSTADSAAAAAASAAGVDINVLQCDDNISLTDSTTDVTASPSQQPVRFSISSFFSLQLRVLRP